MSSQERILPLKIPCVYYYENFFDSQEAQEAYDNLSKTIPWETTAKINRWVCLQQQAEDETNNNNSYQYRDAPSKDDGTTLPYSDTVRRLKEKIEDFYNTKHGTNIAFNVCLLNFYEDGSQRIGWHSDREEIGRDTPIASVSLGATRDFCLRSKTAGGQDRATVSLQSGSLVIMENICQHQYLHSIPRQAQITEGRINLTFRCKTVHTAGEEEHERRDRWLEHIVDVAPGDPSTGDFRTVDTEWADSKTILFGDDVRTEFSSPNPHVVYVISCNIGTEKYAAAEISEQLEEWEVVICPWGIAGYVALVQHEEQDIDELNSIRQAPMVLLTLKSVLHVMEYHDHFDLNQINENMNQISGEDLYQFYKQRLMSRDASIPSLSHEGTSVGFRVTSERIGGPHGFRGPEVEREIGGAISEYYSPQAIPKMEDYDIHVRVDVVGSKVIIGTQLNVDDLSKQRHFLRFRNAVSIKCNLAYIMVRLANLEPGQTVLDPFCGSGTLLLEAMEVFSRKISAIGLDVSRRTVRGAEENATAEGLIAERCTFHCCDARALRKHVADNSVDAIITNLPWGVRTGHKQTVQDLQQMYEVFLRSAWYILKDGSRIVMLVLRGLQLTRLLRKLSGRYRLLSATVVRTTNNLPCLLVVERLGRDIVHDGIKAQLAHMSQYVTVSKDLYHAIHMENIDDHN